MTSYVLDDLALIAGFTADGEEKHRRELSRLLISAIDHGPNIGVPALCMAAAAVRRPEIADHLAELIVGGPSGAIDIVGLRRTAEVAQLRSAAPGLGRPSLHAALAAMAVRAPIVTTDPSRFSNTAVEAITS